MLRSSKAQRSYAVCRGEGVRPVLWGDAARPRAHSWFENEKGNYVVDRELDLELGAPFRLRSETPVQASWSRCDSVSLSVKREDDPSSRAVSGTLKHWGSPPATRSVWVKGPMCTVRGPCLVTGGLRQLLRSSGGGTPALVRRVQVYFLSQV